jgi:transcriptional activator SPT7
MVENEDKRAKDLINTFNRQYHTFENDRENFLKQRKLEESDRQMDSDMLENPAVDKMTSTATFGAANLSLKHLLATIDARRDQLSLSEFELRNLLSDVRKNRSKWASEDKIGQEELYEAAEKVVLELRGYTEHSTAFLNKVSKRDAPNYFNVIKHPMDLSSVMKKLKSFQYKSKKEFVDDLMLIWRNCLTYNTDPKHFLRAHAIAMQKKTLSLVPLIPDIVVRDRAEVEAEEARAEASVAHESDEELAAGGKHTTKGRKRKLDTEEANGGGTGGVPPPFSSPAPPNVQAVATPTVMRASPFPRTEGWSTPTPGPDIDSELNETLKEESREEDLADLDVETLVWQSLFSRARSSYCSKRSDLFKDDKIQPDAEAILRKSLSMGKFADIISSMFRPSEDRRDRLFQLRGLLETLDTDRQQFILEYEVAAGIPPIPGLPAYMLFDEDEDEMPSSYQRVEDVPESEFVVREGLAKKFHANLEEIQQIRKICSKISLIRQMQQPYIHANQMDAYNPPPILEQDVDVGSRLPGHDPFNKDVAAAAMKRAVSKIAMHNGFEVTELSALDALGEIAADYMTKLGRSLVTYMEDYNEMACEHKVLTTLRENGIESLLSLDSYARDDIERHGTRLQDLRRKLTSFMADLLRPGLTEFTDTQFGDDSEQFLSGDFSMEIGDDFFGFRELGLDKELGLLTSSVPFHLLQAKLSASFNQQSDLPVITDKSHQVPDYPPMDMQAAQMQIGLLRPFFIARLEASPKSDVLLEGDKLPPKQRNIRPKLPPTGKIPGVKKKSISKAFFRPDRVEPKKEEVNDKVLSQTAVNADEMELDETIDSLF